MNPCRLKTQLAGLAFDLHQRGHSFRQIRVLVSARTLDQARALVARGRRLATHPPAPANLQKPALRASSAPLPRLPGKSPAALPKSAFKPTHSDNLPSNLAPKTPPASIPVGLNRP